VPHCCTRSVWAPRDQRHYGDKNHHGDLQFSSGPPWSVCLLLRSSIPWQIGSDGWLAAMLLIWARKWPPRGRCAFIPRSCNTSIRLRLRQPSWVPWMRDLSRSVDLQAHSGHPRFYARSQGLPVGCVPDGPSKYFWVLGRLHFESFLRSACLEWLCQTLAAMQDIWMSLHSIRSRSTFFYGFIIDNSNHHRRPLHATHLSRSWWVSSDTGHR
jgi:hypothetical protein